MPFDTKYNLFTTVFWPNAIHISGATFDSTSRCSYVQVIYSRKPYWFNITFGWEIDNRIDLTIPLRHYFEDHHHSAYLKRSSAFRTSMTVPMGGVTILSTMNIFAKRPLLSCAAMQAFSMHRLCKVKRLLIIQIGTFVSKLSFLTRQMMHEVGCGKR